MHVILSVNLTLLFKANLLALLEDLMCEFQEEVEGNGNLELLVKG